MTPERMMELEQAKIELELMRPKYVEAKLALKRARELMLQMEKKNKQISAGITRFDFWLGVLYRHWSFILTPNSFKIWARAYFRAKHDAE